MIESILPPYAACAEAFTDVQNPVLYAEEEEIVLHAVDARRRAFATARHCARRALTQLGEPPAAIPRNERGAPRWPSGVVGSITHCDGYRASAVAHAHNAAALGIDAEPDLALPSGILERIASSSEQDSLTELARLRPLTSWGRLLFSAKEAAYKAWHPLTELQLGFKDAEVTFHLASGRFEARLLESTSCGVRLTGRWLAHDGLLLTAVVVS